MRDGSSLGLGMHGLSVACKLSWLLSDPGRVEMRDPLERQYWAQALRCTELQLAAAVAKVGAHVAALREFLHKRL